MTKYDSPIHPHFKPLAAALISAGLLAVAPFAMAQAPSVADLQAELARVREENARLIQQLAAAVTAPATAPLAASAAPVATASDAGAEEPLALGEITVRGRRKIETVKEVPVSISVVTGQELQRELAQDLSSFTKRGANIQFNQNNTRGASLSIRGLGKRSFTETRDPSVGMVVDGVSYGLSQLGNFDFYDVESVEVIRGPSGTLGGKAASSGVVTVNTKLAGEDKTCKNWSSSAESGVAAQVGHFDRSGGGNASWNSIHPSRGCSQPQLVTTGGARLLYCFAAK